MTKVFARTLTLLLPIIFLTPQPVFAGDGHAHHDEESAESHEPARGPHGGRLLTEGKFALEVTIFEAGVPPQYRLFAYYDEEVVSPKDVSAEITLTRFGGRIDKFRFQPTDDFLSSSNVVEEPHSFEVTMSAIYNGEKYSWHYESFEGRTELSEEAIAASKIQILTAGPMEIAQEVTVYGEILANEDRVAHIHPRFPGVVRQIRKALGDQVKSGDVLAVIESNQSLQEYEVRSQLDGVVIQRHLSLGEYVAEAQELFVVADLSHVWVDFQLYRDDYGVGAIGQKVSVDIGDGKPELDAQISYVSPVTDRVTQSMRLRAVLPNQDGRLRPGNFVAGKIMGDPKKVPVAVARQALQTFRDWDVVFVTDGRIFQAIPVEVGRKDSRYAEIVSGLTANTKYVADNSFIIKADIEKAGASHDH